MVGLCVCECVVVDVVVDYVDFVVVDVEFGNFVGYFLWYCGNCVWMFVCLVFEYGIYVCIDVLVSWL